MGNEDDFHTNELDTLESVIGLSPRDPLNGFAGWSSKLSDHDDGALLYMHV